MERDLTPYERPFGGFAWIGTALAACLWLEAVWVVLGRILSRTAGGFAAEAMARIPAEAAAEVILCLLFLLAARVTDSIVSAPAFLVCAAGEMLCLISRIAAPSGTAAAALELLPWAMRTAAFLTVSVNRENVRDARRFAAAAAGVLFVCFTGETAAYYGAAQLLVGTKTVESSLGIVAAGSAVTFLGGIAARVLAGTAFLFLRTPTPSAQYPKKRNAGA